MRYKKDIVRQMNVCNTNSVLDPIMVDNFIKEASCGVVLN
jgi:hypothetical protein